MTNGPARRATAESGDTIDDPSEDALFLTLDDIEAGEGTHLIVDVLGDVTSRTFAQTSRNSDGSYIVEYRDGAAERHFGTIAPDVLTAHALLTGWAFAVPGWRDSAAEWEQVHV
ncbi:hypothetical protein [Nocardioides sp.]|uniref:hypothetical protein n=1 Tax=Nocardioides sp. TaxID=35761 RepID=UPI00271D188C|nr:hypothetical protein [Nocardioides sp.]MDO9454506.1 hypothetical protein [Nocardioides sp.]